MHHIEERSQGGVVAQPGHLLVRLSLQDGQDLPGVGQRLGFLFHVADRVSLDPIISRSLSQDICDGKMVNWITSVLGGESNGNAIRKSQDST